MPVRNEHGFYSYYHLLTVTASGFGAALWSEWKANRRPQECQGSVGLIVFIRVSIAQWFFLFLTAHRPFHILRSSSSSNLLQIPRTNLIFGSRSFHAAAPTVWNSLPDSIRSSNTLNSFRHHLKTHYFQAAFNIPELQTPAPLIHLWLMAFCKCIYLLTEKIQHHNWQMTSTTVWDDNRQESMEGSEMTIDRSQWNVVRWQ